jgi:hypothetical protein
LRLEEVSERVLRAARQIADVRRDGGRNAWLDLAGVEYYAVGRMAELRRVAPASDELPMKVVGRRQWRGGLVASAGLLELALRLRDGKPFIPKGVHRFASFEESDVWFLTMLTRLQKHAPRS